LIKKAIENTLRVKKLKEELIIIASKIGCFANI